MDHAALAAKVLELVGGEKNVKMATHCITRLRFNLKNPALAETAKLKATPGVLGVIDKGAQYQVVIGNDVQNVFGELMKIRDFSKEDTGGDAAASSAAPADAGAKAGEQPSLFNRVFDTVAGIFTPFLPALTGAGMIKAVIAILLAFKLLDPSSQTLRILSFIADTAFYYMPILLAYSAAAKFRANPYLAMALGGALLHPDFLKMVAEAAGGGGIHFFGVPVPLVRYASSVIPIILSVWFMAYVQRFAERISPKTIKFFTVPLITLIITAPVMLTLIGPLGHYVGAAIASGIAFLDNNAPWVTPFVIGAVNPLLVMFGMHYAIIPFGVNNLATLGYDTLIGPGMLVSNIAQGGAALAVALKTKNSSLKQLASSAGVTAVFGITEPAMYGVTLKYKRPLYAVLVAGGAAGLFAGITGVRRFMSGSPGLLTMPAYLGEPLSNFFFAVIAAVIGFVIAFLLTYFFGYKDAPEGENGNGSAS